VNYVDAGYSIALSVLCLYGLGLGLRRRRWERALKVATRSARSERSEGAGEQAGSGPRS
jgi:hypothetical protein